ncbi:flagellar biosynthesis anti-sigma factor FlgM [Hathewaya massiliensis]|uniref:flagellar biosynthesis anti-sigma factor FlgM n=1 Tax=Hathewaya massiliensis TaxID=1964382 RepID=UPI00115C33BF|nr:flagellar biosynthesis anti-sigma factor FlgM [Hathewaya massiliensis]
MKINNVSMNKLINLYDRKEQQVTPKKKSMDKDRIELSEFSKKLNVCEDMDKKDVDRQKRIMEIKTQIEKGTYNKDSKLVAQKILDNIKGKEI